MRHIFYAPLCALAMLSACKSTSTAVDGVKSAGSSVASGLGSVTTSLVKVDLSNVLNDLALDLKIDKSSIPINAQIPITVAANVCGVSINILSIGGGGGRTDGCTANSISPELKQYIQQQIAANGNVGGGAQTNSGATTGTTGSTTTTPTQPAPKSQTPEPGTDPQTPTPQQ